jgi:hypothetical protein
MSIYDDLIRFKLGLLERVTRELPKLHPVAQKAAKVDVTFIENQMAGYYDRLDLWYQREIPCELVNRPGRGYSLTFRNAD